MKRLLPLFSLVFAAFAARAGGSSSSESFVFLEPEKSSFWRTIESDTVTVSIAYPDGATSATLYVEGLGYSVTNSAITGDSTTVTLPPATSATTEDVYVFTIVFDNGVTNSIPLGHIRGYGTDGEGTTRLLSPRDPARRYWTGADGRSVLPIPYGTTSFTIDGEAYDTGLGGAQGWYALPKVPSDGSYALAIAGEGFEATATVTDGRHGRGLVIMFR